MRLTIALALLSGLAAQTSRPQSDDTLVGAWLPLQAGSYWEYGPESVQYLECVASTRENAAGWFTLSSSGRGIPQREEWCLRPDGIYWRPGTFASGGVRLEQPVKLLGLPLGITVVAETRANAAPNDQPGTWAELPALACRAELEAIGEEVVTPGGTFAAARVAVQLDVEGCPARRVTFWFARGTGIVRILEHWPGGFQTLRLLRRHVPAGAPSDADLVAAARRALAGDPALVRRGEPARIVQLRDPGMRGAFASRFARACWNDGSVLLRERGDTVIAFDPRSTDDLNRLLEDGAGRLGSGPRALQMLADGMPALLQENGAAGSGPLPVVTSVKHAAAGGTVDLGLGERVVKWRLTVASGAKGLRVAKVESW